MFGRDSEAVQKFLSDGLAGRVSRRDLVRRAAALGLSVPAITALASTTAFAQGTPAAGPSPDPSVTGDLEVFSLWTSGDEAAALDELFKAFNAAYPNVEIINATVTGGAGVAAQSVLQARLASGDPPDSWKTHIGRELYDRYVTPGYCDPITSLYDSEGWNDVIPQGLIDQVTQDGEKYAIPVGVHRSNGFWYNKAVLEAAGVTIGETLSLDEFFTAADTIKAGGAAAAFGMGDNEAFVAPQNFENTLLAVAGPENYNALWAGELGWDDPSVTEATETFAHLLEYVNDDHQALTWPDAAQALFDGKLAFNAMGDWFYDEVVTKNMADQVGWVSAPGTAGSFVLVVDCFTLPKGAPNAAAAEGWLKSLGTVGAQAAFNPLKGSIPARTDVPRDGFSDYHIWSMDSFAEDALVASMAHGEAASSAFQQSIYDAVNAFVVDKDVETLVSTIAAASQE